VRLLAVVLGLVCSTLIACAPVPTYVECEDGRDACNDSCVDPHTDPDHCGPCDNFRAPDENRPGFDYAALLVQLFESARLRAPASPRVLLTDERTALPSFGPGVQVLRFPIDRSRLMYGRMRLQPEYPRARVPGGADFTPTRPRGCVASTGTAS